MDIKTKKGLVSGYGFTCGYVQKRDTEYLHKELYKEHGVFHVRSTFNRSPELSSDFGTGHVSHTYVIWETFDNLKDARKFYFKIK